MNNIKLYVEVPLSCALFVREANRNEKQRYKNGDYSQLHCANVKGRNSWTVL